MAAGRRDGVRRAAADRQARLPCRAGHLRSLPLHLLLPTSWTLDVDYDGRDFTIQILFGYSTRNSLQHAASHTSSQSASRNLLDIPRMRTGFAQRSFTYSAPHIWNSLPHIITGNLDVTAGTSEKKLKTFYYTNCYP